MVGSVDQSLHELAEAVKESGSSDDDGDSLEHSGGECRWLLSEEQPAVGAAEAPEQGSGTSWYDFDSGRIVDGRE